MADFNKNQGGVQPSTATEYDPLEAGTPKTGFTEAPKAANHMGEPGPGIGNTRQGIH